MTSMFDLYMKNNIMTACEEHFNAFLKKEGVPEEGLTEDERELVGKQVDYLLGIIQDIYMQYKDDLEAYTEISDKLIGIAIISKMNEVRFCRLLNEVIDKLKDN